MTRLALLALLLLCKPAWAAIPDLSGLAFAPHPGAQVPINQTLRDAQGRPVRLRDVLAGRPAVLELGYYHCPNLCGVTRDDALAALAASGLRVPGDASFVMLSIDPAETPRDAAAAKAADIAQTGADGSGWHFLTGPSAAVARAIGFPSRWNAQLKQFLHPTGVVVLTPAGVVSSYLLGVGYTGAQVRAAVLRAAVAQVAPAPSPLLLLCFHFDPSTGRYSLDIQRALRAAGLLTVAVLGAWLGLTHLRRRQT